MTKKTTKKTTKKKVAKTRKKPGPKKGEGGRPKFVFDWEEIRAMAEDWATEEEIAASIGCDISTLARGCKRELGQTFAEFSGQRMKVGDLSIRRTQKRLAEAGDRTMLVWLGKNRLGQTDKQEVTADVKTISKVIYLPSNGRE